MNVISVFVYFYFNCVRLNLINRLTSNVKDAWGKISDINAKHFWINKQNTIISAFPYVYFSKHLHVYCH